MSVNRFITGPVTLFIILFLLVLPLISPAADTARAAGTETQEKAGHGNLQAYIDRIDQARQSMQAGKWNEAAVQVKQLQRDWISVEGDVVSQSHSVYEQSEKDLGLMGGYAAKADTREKAISVAERMSDSLKPLAASGYSIWDAALIPIREGLEAVLVIGALLTFAKRAQSRRAKAWIWSGTGAAFAVCLAIGAAVSLLLSAAAFGHNNMLINGWSGVFASLMLLYVGYWLHRNADIKRWNQFIRSKTEKAVSQQRMIVFAMLAFVAVLREGLETVIFLFGLAGHMPASRLVLGIAVGFGILTVLGFVLLKASSLIPLKPLFLISSLVVFYLCFKFLGSGIHSLQMAGTLPSGLSEALPTVGGLSIFPSWYSTIPQALLLLAFILIFIRGTRLGFHRRAIK
ncbi:FTR1 family protein [Sporolactobacillus vineae]|uniref:FTR1 family protein n=1 Tax=Sporolactobacillus vineae TaxID=444463 RepID=UPI0002883020|nr:FTR1 family protein [Sporolactobacillus vineae]